MKAVGYILLSYLHQRFWGMVFLISALGIFLFANIMAIYSPNSAFIIGGSFLFSLMVMTGVTTFHSILLAQSSATDLLPNYRRSQLTASGLLLAIFIIWPMVVMAILGEPALIVLAIYLFFACLMLWSTVYYFINSSLNLIVLLGIGLLLRDVYRLIGFSPEESVIGLLGIDGDYFLPIFAIAVSILGFMLFALYYRKMPSSRFTDELIEALCTTGFPENADTLAMKISEKSIQRLSRKRRGSKLSVYRWARLIKFSLFSPTNAANNPLSIVVLVLLFTVAHYLHFLDEAWSGILLMLYYMGGMMLAVDMWDHMKFLPETYFRSPLPSRSSFLKTTLFSYLLVAGKGAFYISLAIIIDQFYFQLNSWETLPQIIAMGFILSLAHISVSLLACDVVILGPIGWYIAHMIAIALILFTISFGLLSFAWYFVAASALFSGLLFVLSIRKWLNTDMEFVGA